MERLYFDYNATAPLAKGLKEKLSEWAEWDPKNPVSIHQDGRSVHQATEEARKTILKYLGATDKDALIFSSGGTESNNTALHSAFLERGGRNQMLLSNVEHSCVFNYAKYLEEHHGVELVFVEVDRHGKIDLEDYANKLTDNVFFVSTMLVNNEAGFIFPVREMAMLAREKGIPFHTDVVAAIGKMPVSFQDLGVDFMTYSSHKFGGLKGSGGLICRADAKVKPMILGGTHENEKRAGTMNVFGVLSSAYALEVNMKNLEEKVAHEKNLREILKSRIREVYPEVSFIESENNIYQTVSASFVGLNGNLLLTNLDLEGVSASYGSACASGSLEISRVMRNLKLSINEARAALRFSFGCRTTEDDVNELGLRLARVIERMKLT